MKRFIERVGALVGVLVLALAVGAQPAAAAPGGCLTANVICFYNSDTDSGPIQIYSGDVARNTCLDVPDNLTSWIKNNTGVRWRVFKTTNCTGTEAPIYPYTAGPMNSTWNNVIGSTVRTSSTSKVAGPSAMVTG